jgi:hypothetical protein
VGENSIDFKSLMENVNIQVDKEIRKGVSKSTMFVCLLHLTNEKSK